MATIDRDWRLLSLLEAMKAIKPHPGGLFPVTFLLVLYSLLLLVDLCAFGIVAFVFRGHGFLGQPLGRFLFVHLVKEGSDFARLSDMV